MPARQTTSDRIDVLDVLRGIAILGMFFVHFRDDAQSATGGVGAFYAHVVSLFFDERFWAMFGILFGVGFAVQWTRADGRGEHFVGRYPPPTPRALCLRVHCRSLFRLQRADRVCGVGPSAAGHPQVVHASARRPALRVRVRVFGTSLTYVQSAW